MAHQTTDCFLKYFSNMVQINASSTAKLQIYAQDRVQSHKHFLVGLYTAHGWDGGGGGGGGRGAG